MFFKADLQASYLSGTYCHNTSTRPPSCTIPRELTKYDQAVKLNTVKGHESMSYETMCQVTFIDRTINAC